MKCILEIPDTKEDNKNASIVIAVPRGLGGKIKIVNADDFDPGPLIIEITA